ncbi:MAG: hypothetical protein P1U41_05420 [Vicingaceae bacterium]|nr:hypothetical protein [Vicingaceae bacterium]
MKKLFIFFTFTLMLLQVKAQDDYVSNEKIPSKEEVYDGIPNPDFTNYTFTASAYTLKKRDFRFSNTDIIFNKVSYGLSNRTTASLNTSFAGTFIGAIKHNINLNEGVDLAFSASAGQALYLPKDSIIYAAGLQSLITFGDLQNNFTVGAGFYYAKSNYGMVVEERELYLQNIFVATQQQLRPKTYLVAEGIYFLNYNAFAGSLALKFIIKTRMSLLVGLMPIYRDGRVAPNRSVAEGGVIPVASFRMYLDRH